MKLTAEQREDNKIFDEYLKIRLPDGSGTTLGYFRAGWMACKRLAHTEPEDELSRYQIARKVLFDGVDYSKLDDYEKSLFDSAEEWLQQEDK